MGGDRRHEIELRLLGPVELRFAGQVVDLGPPRQRNVVAALAVDVGQPVSAETVVARVWGRSPPDRARHALYVYLARIRAVLRRAGAGDPVVRLIRRPGGYVLELDPDRVDLHRFRRLVDRAGEAGLADAEQLALLHEALGLWRGMPLANLSGEWVERMREGLQEQRLDLVTGWSAIETRLGNAASIIGPLTELTAEFPLAESLVAALMRALHAAGRGGHALDCYTSVRKRLADELGVDPGPELQQVHQALLRGDLDADPVAPAAPARPVPAQLPLDVRGFTGRRAELRQLDATLAAAESTGVTILVISGTAGVGKTALAVHWAHRVADQFPDGRLYVNLHWFHPSGQLMQPATAVRGFLDALGVPAERIPADPDAQAALYRSLLADKRVLVVLDNVRDAEQVRPLLPGTGTALVLVTSRNQLTSLVAADGAHPLTLDLLTPDEAHELLTRRLGSGRVAAEPRAVEQIIDACARLPLALAIAAARAAQTGFPLTVLAGELADARGRLGVLDAGDPATGVRAVFSWSYATLTPPAARLFRLLGLHPGPDTSPAAAASLTGLPPAETGRLLAELTRANLTTEHTPGRYSLHDLLSAYAAELCHTTDPDHDSRAAVGRLLDHYAHTAHTADRLLHPTRDPIQLPLTPPTPGVTPEQPADDREALAWLDTERPVLLAALRLAVTTGADTHTWQLAWTLNTFLWRRGHWQDQAGAWQAAVAAADRLTHPTAAAYAHRHLAWSGIRRGRHGEAHTHLRRALDLHTRAGDRAAGQADTHLALAALWERQDRSDQALDHAQQALTLYQAADDCRGQAIALNTVGWYHALLGDHTQALTYCQQALTLSQQAGDRYGEANTWDSLGYAHHHLHQHTQAVDCYQHALTLFRDLSDRYQEADILTHLGDTHHTAGNPAAARTAWTHALTILTDLDHPDTDTVHAKLHDLDRTPTGNSG